MTKITRRQFIAGLGTAAAASFIDVRLPDDPVAAPVHAHPAQQHHVYVAESGTPVTNVQEVIKLAGGIASFDLGGMWLNEIDVSLRGGIMQVTFRDPTKQPVDRMHFSCVAGNIVLYRVGNTSPRSSGKFSRERFQYGWTA